MNRLADFDALTFAWKLSESTTNLDMTEFGGVRPNHSNYPFWRACGHDLWATGGIAMLTLTISMIRSEKIITFLIMVRFYKFKMLLKAEKELYNNNWLILRELFCFRHQIRYWRDEDNGWLINLHVEASLVTYCPLHSSVTVTNKSALWTWARSDQWTNQPRPVTEGLPWSRLLCDQSILNYIQAYCSTIPSMEGLLSPQKVTSVT